MLRRIGALNFLDHFRYGALTIALPLYLLSKGTDVGEIGLVLSLLPLAFLLVRVVSSVFADVFGVKMFFIASGVFNVLSSAVYAFAGTPLQFGLGKIGEGASSALFWAVDRTAIIARAHQKKYLMLMSVVREFGAALGLIGGGLLIAFFSFEAVFALLVLLGIVWVLVSLQLVNRGATVKKPEWKSLFRIRGREMDFWQVSAAIVLINVSFNLLFVFLLPLLMDAGLGMSYLEIAVMLTAFYVCMGIGGLLSVRLGEGKKSLLFQLMAIPLILFLPFDGGFFSIALMLAGLGFGVCFGINEGLLGYISEKEKGVSSKLAVLIAPLNIVSFLVLAGSGFALKAFGNFALFGFCALLLAGFVVLAKKISMDIDGKGVLSYRPHKGPASRQTGK
jgi:MFS family permease